MWLDLRSGVKPSLSITHDRRFRFQRWCVHWLEAETLSPQDLDFAQQHLRMLSGLYGVLRPLDLMQPYRLEMGTKLANARGANLYQFWGDIITEKLNQAIEAQGDNVLVNLASNEYFKAVNPKRLNAQIVTPIFKDAKMANIKSSASLRRKHAAWWLATSLKIELNR